MQSTSPELLYHLKSVPAGLQFGGIVRDDSRGQGLVYVIYKSTADPSGSPAVQIVLSRTYSDPEPLVLRDASIATAADFLPVPGVVLSEAGLIQEALWIGDSGLYRLEIDPNRSSLTIQGVASLLEPFTPAAPGPPQTGSGGARPQDSLVRVALSGTVLVVAGMVALYECRRRVVGVRQR